MKYKKLKIDFKDKRGSITDIFYKKIFNMWQLLTQNLM